MQPLIVADHVRRGIADFLATSFPGTTPGFEGLMQRFLAEPGNVSRGPFVTISLPFRKADATFGRIALDLRFERRRQAEANLVTVS